MNSSNSSNSSKSDKSSKSSNSSNKEKKSWLKENKDFLWVISFPGRLIMISYSLHGLFFIINIIIQYIILIPGILYDIDNAFYRIIFSGIYLIFAISSSNILVIPLYDFFTFPFLKYENPLSHILSFIYIYKEKEFDIEKITIEFPLISLSINIYLLIMQVLYICGMGLGYLSNIHILGDLVKCGNLFFIYSYYLILVLSYFALSFYLIMKILFSCKKMRNNDVEIYNPNEHLEQKYCPSCYKCCINYINNINYYFEDRPSLPNINLVTSLIDPFLLSNYDIPQDYRNNLGNFKKEFCHLEDIIYTLSVFVKIILVFFSLITFIFIFINITKIDWLSIFLFILLFLVMAGLSISLNFPLFYSFRKSFGVLFCKICFPTIYRNEQKFQPKNSKLLLILRIITDLIIFIAAIAFLYIFHIKEDSDKLSQKFDFEINDKKENTENLLLLPNICYSSIHNMPLTLFLPFINDAYYYGNYNGSEPYYTSSLQYPGYRKFFFNDDYDIKIRGNLINENKTVKMIQYNVINKSKKNDNEITILSIKGTSYKRDIFLDAQLYFSSILLNFLSTFSLSNQKDTYSFRFIEYSLSIPYRLFFRYLMIDDYLKKLQKAYIDNEFSFYKNVVIVGHSLGGGLAKLFGRVMNKQAISLSGPGINAFTSLWEYEGKSENFEISAIDLIPDKDPVPRVEVSGGTIYRIVCKAGIFQCHGKQNSLCEILIMCRDPNYELYCKKMTKFDDKIIKDIYDSSELNNYNK